MDQKEISHKRETDAWTVLGEKILTAAKTELFMSMRYLYLALNSLDFVRNQKTFFVGCDGENIYYNPLLLSEKYKYNPTLINRAYLHMVLHCIFRHIYAANKISTEQLWDISCDIAIEYLIDNMEYSSVRQLIPDVRENVYMTLAKEYPVVSAENVYGYLEKQDDKTLLKLSVAFLVDDHSFWYSKKKQKTEDKNQDNKDNKDNNDNKDNKDNQDNKDDKDNNNNKDNSNKDNNGNKDNEDNKDDKDNKDSSNNNSKQNDDKWKDISEKMQTELSTYQSSIGDEHHYLSKYLTLSNSEKMSYKEFLKKFAVSKETMQVDMDAFDYGFYNFGMQMYGNMPLIEELEYKEEQRIEDFVIVLDTSGSCSGQLIKKFLEETYAILLEQESFFNKINLHIIQCDNEIQSDICIHSRKELDEYKANFEVKGFGGTDFRPAFEYVNSLIEKKQFNRLNGMLYFTDGNGIYPTKKPPYQVAFIFVETKGELKQVPPWAIKLEIT